MEVRQATAADRGTMLALWDEWNEALEPPPWVPADARAGTAAGIDEAVRAGLAFVAERAGQVLGFAAGLPRGSGALELTELYVRPGERGGGVARALVRAVVAAGAEAGAAHVFVATDPGGDTVAVYERWGFRGHSLELVASAEELLDTLGP